MSFMTNAKIGMRISMSLVLPIVGLLVFELCPNLVFEHLN